jgi:pilus assembly protein Flp/PilA
MLYMYCLLRNLAVRRPLKSEDGVTAIEYGLIAALIAVAIIAAVSAVGGSLTQLFNTVSSTLGSAP